MTAGEVGDAGGIAQNILSALKSGTTSGEASGAVGAAFDAASLGLLASGVGAPAAAVVAAIGAALQPIIASFKGCGQTCILATQDINQIGAAMTQAYNAYMQSDPHYYSAQQTFLSQFMQLIGVVKTACGNPALGQAGQDCISENTDPNACHWKASPGGWNPPNSPNATYTPWGPSGSGSACWNPFVMYNAVLNDPTVVPDPVSNTSSSLLSSAGFNPSATVFGIPLALLLPAGLIVLGLLL